MNTPPRRLLFGLTALSTLVAASGACRGPQPSTEIAAAVLTRDQGALVRLLAARRSPEEGSPRPIVWAARTGNAAAITLLVEGGANPDRPDGVNGWTPLQHAVHKRQPDAVAALLRAGADPNRRSPPSLPPLMMAAAYGDEASFDLLLKAGADPTFEVEPGIGALWAALGGGAIADLTDGPPFGSCFPRIVSAINREAPALRIRRGGETRLLRLLARPGCRALIDANAG